MLFKNIVVLMLQKDVVMPAVWLGHNITSFWIFLFRVTVIIELNMPSEFVIFFKLLYHETYFLKYFGNCY